MASKSFDIGFNAPPSVWIKTNGSAAMPCWGVPQRSEKIRPMSTHLDDVERQIRSEECATKEGRYSAWEKPAQLGGRAENCSDVLIGRRQDSRGRNKTDSWHKRPRTTIRNKAMLMIAGLMLIVGWRRSRVVITRAVFALMLEGERKRIKRANMPQALAGMIE
ncbi:hypothetical protein FJY63_03955 [Candidatus Sumerlaeota bacterium]|nr:hypothetical protein [Candidatus Sumerlaeota bacterium]